jgi:hypothetical protein
MFMYNKTRNIFGKLFTEEHRIAEDKMGTAGDHTGIQGSPHGSRRLETPVLPVF